MSVHTNKHTHARAHEIALEWGDKHTTSAANFGGEGLSDEMTHTTQGGEGRRALSLIINEHRHLFDVDGVSAEVGGMQTAGFGTGRVF